MPVRPESRWWIVLLVLVGLLFGLSALALNRPDVVWSTGEPACPQCRRPVEPFSTRCPTCREEYDWTASPEEDSPISPWSLSPLEERHLRARIKALGEEAAVARVAIALGIPPLGAGAYLKQVGSGRCGWCGGTGRDLSSPPEAKDPVCPACFGSGACVACGGDRSIRVGDGAAARDLHHYLQEIAVVSRLVDLQDQRLEVLRLGREFLKHHAGTLEAQQVVFAPKWTPGNADPETTVKASRARLDGLIKALPNP